MIGDLPTSTGHPSAATPPTIPTPVSAVRVRGFEGRRSLHKRRLAGVIRQAPDGSLYCEVTPVHPRNADAKKKQLRDPQGREAGSEEFGRDEDENENTEQHDHDVCDTCAGSGECRDCGGSGVRAGDRQRGWIEEENGDRDGEAMIERIPRAVITHTESAPPRFDGMMLDQLRARHAERMRVNMRLPMPS